MHSVSFLCYDDIGIEIWLQKYEKKRNYGGILINPRVNHYQIGRHLQIELDEDTNEVRTQLLDWVLFKTYVIET